MIDRDLSQLCRVDLPGFTTNCGEFYSNQFSLRGGLIVRHMDRCKYFAALSYRCKHPVSASQSHLDIMRSIISWFSPHARQDNIGSSCLVGIDPRRRLWTLQFLVWVQYLIGKCLIYIRIAGSHRPYKVFFFFSLFTLMFLRLICFVAFLFVLFFFFNCRISISTSSGSVLFSCGWIYVMKSFAITFCFLGTVVIQIRSVRSDERLSALRPRWFVLLKPFSVIDTRKQLYLTDS